MVVNASSSPIVPPLRTSTGQKKCNPLQLDVSSPTIELPNIESPICALPGLHFLHNSEHITERSCSCGLYKRVRHYEVILINVFDRKFTCVLGEYVSGYEVSGSLLIVKRRSLGYRGNRVEGAEDVM